MCLLIDARRVVAWLSGAGSYVTSLGGGHRYSFERQSCERWISVILSKVINKLQRVAKRRWRVPGSYQYTTRYKKHICLSSHRRINLTARVLRARCGLFAPSPKESFASERLGSSKRQTKPRFIGVSNPYNTHSCIYNTNSALWYGSTCRLPVSSSGILSP